jgi:hypothetical protein
MNQWVKLGLIVLFATATTFWTGGRLGVFILMLWAGCVAVYGCDWSELKADRRAVSEPVVRERRRRDYEVGR